jgi:hypothetical protein
MNPVVARSHHTPTKLISRDGCPCKMTPYYQTSEIPPGDRTALINHFTTMRLVHFAKDGTIKDVYPLKLVHEELETTSLKLRGSGASNILLYKVSFECLITLQPGKQIREFVRFNLKIRGTSTKADSVLSYDMLEKVYGNKENLYAVLKHLYDLGRKIANPDGDKHGHEPEYDPDSSKHDQYIRHTEQLLAAYLMLPEGAQMLIDQLRGVIRAKYAEASGVKVYNMGLHMHSTKTCCGPCENTLVGLMNKRMNFTQDGKQLGFFYHFKKAAAAKNDTLTMSLPLASFFRLLVTVTATEHDADHRAQPQYKNVILGNLDTPFYDISIKSQITSQSIFSTMISPGYDTRRIPDASNLSDMTVGISGSKQTPGSKKTMAKVRQVRLDEELKEAERLP